MKIPIVFRSRGLRTIFRELASREPSPQAKHISIGSHDVIEVTFTEEQAQLIIEKAKDVTEDTKRRMINRLHGPPNRWQTGFFGQVAFGIYADGNFEKAYSELKSYYEPDKHDVVFKGWRMDVKTFDWLNRTQNPRSWLLVNLGQFRKRRYPYYIACQRIDYFKVRILGFISLADVQKLPTEDYGIGLGYSVKSLSKLTPIAKLKNLEPKNQ